MVNREEWLTQAVQALHTVFEGNTGRTLPDVAVSVGWPTSGGLAAKRRGVGQCFPTEDTTSVFISPLLDDPFDILVTLTHELVHAVVGSEAGHKGAFIDLAREVGLANPWTASRADENLEVWLLRILDDLPEYPHVMLEVPEKAGKKQTTRMRKMEAKECGCVARTTKKYLALEGTFKCPHGNDMEVDDVPEAPSVQEPNQPAVDN